jgi:mRNA-degrading endonuclease RelE of RelBE toxin-antitoxin system
VERVDAYVNGGYPARVLEFRETALFTRAVTALLSDDEYAELQGTLIVNPEAGEVIKEAGGLRKLRWSQQRRGKGKRGGVRIIYYWYAAGPLIYMLLAYSKDERDDLSAAQKKALAQLVREEFK